MRRTFIRFGLTRAALVVSATLSFVFAANADVKVSEVMPCNISTYMVNQNYKGWVELQYDANSGDELSKIQLLHYKLNKSKELVYEWSVNLSGMEGKSCDGYAVYCFDGSDMDSKTVKKFDSKGGAIVLKKSGCVVDSFIYDATQTHVSYGIYGSSKGYMEPTPMKANSQSYSSLACRCALPKFDTNTKPGVLYQTTYVRLSCATADATIHYTTDGSEPTDKSTCYCQEGIKVENGHAAVIRARAYADGKISSPILTGTFLFVDDAHKNCGGNSFTLPIVSIVTDNANLYDEATGIYTDGNGTYSDYPTTSCLKEKSEGKKLNYIMDWDRPGNFEYIVNGHAVLSHEVDLSVMGGCSRKYDVKSLKIKAGNRMGDGNSKLNYDFFSDKVGNVYKSLQLRNGGNGHEQKYIRCRDGFMQAIAKPMNIDLQAYQPVAFYLNGEYLGLMGLRERTNKAYVESNYGLDGEDIDVIEITNNEEITATCGDKEAYNKLVSFLESNNPTGDSYYAEAAKMMDMDEYIDYQIFQQFIVNTDWPGNNSKLWRERNNGRFRWIVFDTDFGLGLYNSGDDNHCFRDVNMIEWASGKEGTISNWANNESWKTTIFRHLLQNPTFKEKFVNRYLMHLGSTFKPAKIEATWDSIQGLVKNEFCATFNSELSDHGMVDFAKDRPSYIYEHLKGICPEYSGYAKIKVLSSVSGAHILMNGDLIPADSMSGKYFINKQLRLEAYAPAGYKFVGWKSGDGNKDVPVEPQVVVDTTNLAYTSDRVWKYYTAPAGIDGTSWQGKIFTDTKWKTGSGRMGYNDKTDNEGYDTPIESGEKGDHYATVYFRSKFNIDDVSSISAIVARITFDDGYAFYVNGREIRRSNLPEAKPTAFIGQYANDSTEVVIIPSSWLKSGENIFAIELHQHEATSSDVTLLFEEAIVKGDGSNQSQHSGEYISTDPVLLTTVNGDMTLKAVFEETYDCDLPAGIYINELCSSNKSEGGTPDEYGNYPDWFEVYNSGNETVDLAGYYLTDKTRESDAKKYMIPYGYEVTKIAPKSRIVFWADNMSFRGPLHVGFKLSSDEGSYVALNKACKDYVDVVDYVIYSSAGPNQSVGYASDGGSDWVTFGVCSEGIVYYPTPGGANSSYMCNSDECFYTSVEETEVDEDFTVAVYPNPVLDLLNIKVADAESISLSIYDNIGRLCGNYTDLSASVSLNVKYLTPGVYHLEIMAGGEVYKRTILKK